MKRRYLIVIVASLLVLFGCVHQEVKPPQAGEEAKRVIEVGVSGQKLLYQCQSFWSGEKFLEISQDDLKVRFKERYSVDAKEFAFSFEPSNHSTVTKCHIHGAIARSGNRYTADLVWLLRPCRLDFINDSFTKSKTGLSWQGIINGIPMSINVSCPPQDCIYEAWQEPVGHCHGHMWWAASQ